MNAIDHSKGILSAQYQNTATSPYSLSQLRGSGQYTTQFPLSSNYYTGDVTAPKAPGKHIPAKGIQSQGVTDMFNKFNVGPAHMLSSETFAGGDYFKYPKSLEYTLEGDPYLQFGLRANNETPTALNTLFFSRDNVKYIQERLLDAIKQITNVKIKPQSENAILQIMNNKYQYSKDGFLPTGGGGTATVHLALPRGPKECSLEKRLSLLNQAVLQDIVKETLSSMRMYMTYYKDASSLPLPLSLPTNASVKGGNVLVENVGLYSGNTRQTDSYNVRNSVIG